jgi:Skp family chaperone for outer membrane proteins
MVIFRKEKEMKKLMMFMGVVGAYSLEGAVQQKTGVISSAEITKSYSKLNDVNKSLLVQFEAAQKELFSMAADFEKRFKEYQELEEKSNNPALNGEAKKKLKMEAELALEGVKQKQNAINDFRVNSENRMTQMKLDESAKIMLTIKQEVETQAKKRGFGFVIDKDNPCFFYVDDTYNITEEVLKELNAKAAAAAAVSVAKTAAEPASGAKTESVTAPGVKATAESVPAVKK